MEKETSWMILLSNGLAVVMSILSGVISFAP